MRSFEIALFTTGGTIDGADSDRGTVRLESDAAKWLSLQPNVKVLSESLFNKDSREITDVDRAKIVSSIEACCSDAIIVTHGTFTIAESARTLKRALGETEKTILFVGAWKAFGEPESDAPTQMEFALQVLRTGRPGVWIAMDERLWNPDLTEKIQVEPGRFKLSEVR
jgi:L-asparaginase